MMKVLRSMICLLLFVGFAASSRAEESEPEVEPSWVGSLGLSYLATTGNSDTQSGGVDFELKRKPLPWGLDLHLTGNRAEENRSVTAERYFGLLRGSRALSERWEIFLSGSAEQDRFAGIDLRLVAASGFGWHTLVGPRHLLDLGAGLTWTDEDLSTEGEGESYLGGQASLDYEWSFSENASLEQKLLYFPNFDDSADWRFESETSVRAQLLSRLALRVSYELRYRNLPIDAKDDTDGTTRVSVVLSF